MDEKSIALKYLSGGISGIIEVCTTHPLDVLKTILQQNSVKKNYKNLFQINTLYQGLQPRLIGIVPMRCIYWGTLDACNHYNNHPKKKYLYFFNGLIAGKVQSLVDTPIEYLKIQAINKPSLKDYNYNFSSNTVLKGFRYTCYRNMFFASTFNFLIHTFNDEKYPKLLIGGISGFISSIISQPLDFVKTYNQTYISKKPLNMYQAIRLFNFSRLMIGWQYRSILSFANMGIGYYCYDIIVNLISPHIE